MLPTEPLESDLGLVESGSTVRVSSADYDVGSAIVILDGRGVESRPWDGALVVTMPGDLAAGGHTLEIWDPSETALVATATLEVR